MTAKKIVQNTFLYTLFAILQKGINFFLLPVYSFYLSPEEYGIVGFITSLSIPLGIAFNLGLNTSIVRFHFHENNKSPEFERRLYGTILTSILVTCGVVLAALLLGAPLVTKFLLQGIPFYPYFVLALIPVAVSPFFEMQQRIWLAKQAGLQFVTLNSALLFLKAGLSLFLVIVMKQGALGILLATAVSSALLSGYSLFILLKRYGLAFDKTLFKECLDYALPLIPNRFVSMSNNYINNFIIKLNSTLASVGLFTVGNQMTSIMTLVDQSVTEAIRPWCYSMFSSNDSKDQIKVADVMGALTIVSTYMATILSVFSYEIVYYFLVESYIEVYRALPYFFFFAAFNQLKNIWLMPLTYYKGGTKYAPIATYSHVLMTLVLSLVLIPRYGMVGAAVSLLASRALSSLLMMFFANLFMKRPYGALLRFYIYPCASLFLVMGLFTSLDGKIAEKAIFCLMYSLISLFIFYRSHKDNVMKLWNMLKKRKGRENARA